MQDLLRGPGGSTGYYRPAAAPSYATASAYGAHLAPPQQSWAGAAPLAASSYKSSQAAAAAAAAPAASLVAYYSQYNTAAPTAHPLRQQQPHFAQPPPSYSPLGVAPVAPQLAPYAAPMRRDYQQPPQQQWHAALAPAQQQQQRTAPLPSYKASYLPPPLSASATYHASQGHVQQHQLPPPPSSARVYAATASLGYSGDALPLPHGSYAMERFAAAPRAPQLRQQQPPQHYVPAQPQQQQQQHYYAQPAPAQRQQHQYAAAADEAPASSWMAPRAVVPAAHSPPHHFPEPEWAAVTAASERHRYSPATPEEASPRRDSFGSGALGSGSVASGGPISWRAAGSVPGSRSGSPPPPAALCPRGVFGGPHA